MKRCKLVISDAGALRSLQAAGSLDLLLSLDMPIVVIDAIYSEMEVDPSCPKSVEIKRFIDKHAPPFIIERTDSGSAELARRRQGLEPKVNALEIAFTDFMTSDDGLRKYLQSGGPVLLCGDNDVRAINKPANLRLISTDDLQRLVNP